MCATNGHSGGSVQLANVHKLRGRERHLTNLRNSSEYPRHAAAGAHPGLLPLARKNGAVSRAVLYRMILFRVCFRFRLLFCFFGFLRLLGGFFFRCFRFCFCFFRGFLCLFCELFFL